MNLRRHVRATTLGIGLLLGGSWVAMTPSVALAQYSPRDDLRIAYEQAKAQFNNLELEGAQQTLEGAIGRAQQYGMANDPALAPLLTLRAGIIYSITGDRESTVMAFGDAVRADYYAAIPIELRSEELQSMLEEARQRMGPPPGGEPVYHQPPVPSPNQDLLFVAKMNIAMLEGFQAALYWRFEGEKNYRSVSMDTFGNLATTVLPASTHQNRNIEYAIYAFDAEDKALANKGATDAPLQVLFGPPQTATQPAPEEQAKRDKPKKKKKREKAGPLPRFFLNFGVGTGVGLARGTVELSYSQFTPDASGVLVNYGQAEQVCAMMRVFAPDGDLPPQSDVYGHIVTMGEAGIPIPRYTPPDDEDMDGNPVYGDPSAYYDRDECGRRHGVTTGTASAPFHVMPEFGVRIADNVVLSVYGRLQVVTGSRVYRGDDPRPTLDSSLEELNLNTLTSSDPVAVRDRPPFTWAVGLKAKYFFMKDRKFRVYVGGFAGGGFSRLMVPLDFANDRNGNSVPDNYEQTFNNNTAEGRCYDVWPYRGCTGTEAQKNADQMVASTVAGGATDERIDTVRLGPVFGGGLAGFNWQIHKNFAIFTEVQVGGWFWGNSTALLDLNLGPVVTF